MNSEHEEVYKSYLQSFEGQTPEVAQVQEVAPQPQAAPMPDKFAAMEQEMARQRRENEELKYNLDLWKAQLTKQNQPAPPIQQLDQDDAMTRGIYEQDVGDKMRALEQQISDMQFQMTANAVQARYSDYDEVIEKYTAPLVKDKPHLADTIRNAPNKPLVAYELGKMYRDSQQPRAPEAPQGQYAYQQVPQSSPQMRMLENAMKPGSLSMTGGQGSFMKQKVDIASMSDAEFDAYHRQVTRDH